MHLTIIRFGDVDNVDIQVTRESSVGTGSSPNDAIGRGFIGGAAIGCGIAILGHCASCVRITSSGLA